MDTVTVDPDQRLRPVLLTSHHWEQRGFFHRWAEKDGKTYAVVEHGGGSVKFYVMLEHYSIEFLDRTHEDIKHLNSYDGHYLSRTEEPNEE